MLVLDSLQADPCARTCRAPSSEYTAHSAVQGGTIIRSKLAMRGSAPYARRGDSSGAAVQHGLYTPIARNGAGLSWFF